MCFLIIGCGENTNDSTENEDALNQDPILTNADGIEIQGPIQNFEVYEHGTHHVQITIKDYGNIMLDVYSYAAPKTAAVFCKNVREGYYDNIPISNIIKGLYIMAKVPESKNEIVKGEFTENGYLNILALKDCMVAMGKSDDDKNSDPSKIIFVLNDVSFLNGKYATFGRISEGYSYLQDMSYRSILQKDASADDITRSNKENPTVEEKLNMPLILEDNGTIINTGVCPIIESMKVVD
ncbi:MAG: peptidylprolyl isomerase [Coriobacteriales bacterium]|nr:peptidylprolyl isomerase [Coriobacteriales bacterium]